MICTLCAASESDGAAAYNIDLVIQEFPDGPQLGVSDIVRIFVHNDIYNYVFGKVILDEFQQPPEIVGNAVIHLIDITATLVLAVLVHKLICKDKSRIINYSRLCGHFLQTCFDKGGVVRNGCIFEFLAERECLVSHIDIIDLVLGEILRLRLFPLPDLP